MSVSGLCSICQSAEANHRCDRCGGIVCDEHFDADFGICMECKAETGAGREPEAGEEHPDVDRYQF